MGLEEKVLALKNYLLQFSGTELALAYSGGMDSTYLLAVLSELRDKISFKVFTVKTELQSQQEVKIIRDEIVKNRLEDRFKVINLNVLALEEIRLNLKNRCYICKLMMFRAIRQETLGVLIDGSNADDFKLFRPGRQALEELQVISPLAVSGITKAEITAWCEKNNSVFTNSCMATRFRYGVELKSQMLNKIDKAEIALRELGFQCVRLRVHDDILRVEISSLQMERFIRLKEQIVKILDSLGLPYITLDLKGFRSGSMDL